MRGDDDETNDVARSVILVKGGYSAHACSARDAGRSLPTPTNSGQIPELLRDDVLGRATLH